MTTDTSLKVITIQEWQTYKLDGFHLAPEDDGLVESLSGESDKRIVIDDLTTGLRICARSWVGVIRFKDLELRIVPKLAGDDIGLLRLVDYTTGMGALDRHPSDHTFKADGANLFDLVVLLFSEATDRIVRSGLLADYKETEDDLGVIRGRLRVRDQVVKRFGQINRLECRFDEHTTDSIENQLLLAALSVAVRRVSDQGVALRVRRLLGVFEEACTLDGFDLRAAKYAVNYTRQNEHYRLAHQLAWIIIDGLGLNDLYAGGNHRTFAFLLDMNRLYEEFITRWFTSLLSKTPYRAIPQRRDRTILWDAKSNHQYASVIPDIVIERRDSPGRFLPVDAKYKLYADKKISPADIYQSFLYAFAYGHSHEELSRGLIIYPISEGDSSHRLHVRHMGKHPKAELLAIGIKLPAALAEAVECRCGGYGELILETITSFLPPQH